MHWESVCPHHLLGMTQTTDDKPTDLERNTSERRQHNLTVQLVTDMDCVLERTNNQSYLFSEVRHWTKNLVWCLPATPGVTNHASYIFYTPNNFSPCATHPKEDARVSCSL